MLRLLMKTRCKHLLKVETYCELQSSFPSHIMISCGWESGFWFGLIQTCFDSSYFQMRELLFLSVLDYWYMIKLCLTGTGLKFFINLFIKENIVKNYIESKRKYNIAILKENSFFFLSTNICLTINQELLYQLCLIYFLCLISRIKL